MKKIFLVFIFLLNLLPILTNEHIMMGLQRIKAQSMGSENVTYYQCEKYNGDMYFSTTPCPASEYPEVCITACKYCQNSMSCDSYKFHHCHNMPSEESKSEWETTPPNTSSNNPSYGGGGGGSSSSGSSSSSQDKEWDKRPDWNHYNPEYCDSYTYNIPRTQFTADLAKATENIVQNNSTCSAACIEKCIAELNPSIYNKIAWDLYTQGKSQIGSLKLPKCFADYSAEELSATGFGQNYADMLIQSALINTMNYVLSYDPVKDNDKSSFFDKMIGNAEGLQMTSSISNMLKSVGFQNVDVLKSPSISDLQEIDFTKNFVIVLCYYNDDDDDDNLNGDILHMHYAQLLGIDKENNAINYWSWHAKRTSSIDKTDNFKYIIKIKR